MRPAGASASPAEGRANARAALAPNKYASIARRRRRKQTEKIAAMTNAERQHFFLFFARMIFPAMHESSGVMDGGDGSGPSKTAKFQYWQV